MLRSFVIACVVILSSTCLAYLAKTTENLRLRSQPSIRSRVMGVVKSNTKITVSGCANGWCRVRANGKIGYIRSTGIKRSTPTSSQKKFAFMLIHLDQVQEPKSVFQVLKECAGNTTCASLATVAGAYFGIPVKQILAAGAVLTKLEYRGEEERDSVFKFPSGYVYCKSRMILTSIVPKDDPRGSIFLAYASASQLLITTWTPKNGAFAGRSWVEANIQVMAVRQKYAEQSYASKQCFRAGNRLLFKCRGGGCPVTVKDYGQNVSNHTPGTNENNR